ISTSERSRFGPARTLGVGNGRDSAMLMSSGFGPAWPSFCVPGSDPAWPSSRVPGFDPAWPLIR
ncbi:hypothetical protein Tco_0447042, partial [Tanacetum coccineum]